jgi:hypothetical protein
MNLPWSAHRCRWLACRSGPLLLLAVAVGCGPREGQLSGQVLYKGKPVPGGWVTFRPANDRANTVNARIDENGHYEARLPVGDAKVAVDNRALYHPPRERPAGGLPPGIKLPPEAMKSVGGGAPAAPPENAPEQLPGNYVPLPPKYYDVDSSGLKVTVTGAGQSYNIDLQ